MTKLAWVPQKTTLEDEILEEQMKLASLLDTTSAIPEEEPQPVVSPVATIPPITTPRPQPQVSQVSKWRPQFVPQSPMPQTSTAPQPAIQPTVQAKPELQWWEKPKEWGESVQNVIGEGITKVPVLPDFLKWAAPGFEWISKNLEEPWAATITAPFSPALPGKPGENWIERQKREYEAWKAPTYVKGAAEFSMPLWWIPWMGWGSKAVKALGVSAKTAKTVSRLTSVLPKAEELDRVLFKPDLFRRAGNWLAEKPLVGSVVKAVGGMSATVKPGLETAENLAKKEIVKRAALLDYGQSATAQGMSSLRLISENPKALFGIGKDGVSNQFGKAFGDVFENPKAFTLNPAQQAYIKESHTIIDDMVKILEEEGIHVSKRDFAEGMHYFPRIVKGKVEFGEPQLARRGEKVGAKPSFLKSRVYEFMDEGVKDGILYEANPDQVMQTFLRGAYKLIADERFAKALKPVGETVKKGTPLGAARVTAPALAGRVFPQDVANLINKTYGESGNAWLKNAASVSGMGRTLVAALDFSAPFIQGSPVLGKSPRIWAKGALRQLQFFAKPKTLQKYLAKEANFIQDRIAYGGYSGGFEYFESMGQLQKGIGKVPLVGKMGQATVRQTYGRAEAAFQGFGEVARNELWKALRPVTPESQLFDLARTIDRMTGVMSTKSLGIGLTQRQLEQAAIFFASRYTRAGMALVSDILKGGISGKLARESLGRLLAGGTAFYIGLCRMLGQQPNLDPTSGRFMTVKIGDRHFGIGGIQYAMMRMAGSVAGDVAKGEATDLVSLSRKDNPFIRFMYNRAAPLTSFTVEAMEGKNFFGEPLENYEDWAKWAASKVTPIALQTVWQEGETTPVTLAGEFAGLRTFPKSSHELRDEARNRYALFEFKKPWEELNRLEQRILEKTHPELVQLAEEADQISARRGDEKQQLYYEWQDRRDDVRMSYEQKLWALADKVDKGEMTPYDFRKQAQRLGSELGGAYQAIDKSPRYQEVIERIEKRKDTLDAKNKLDAAYNEWVANMFGGKFVNPSTGEYDFDAANKFREEFQSKWGMDIYNKVQQTLLLGKNVPPLMKEYYKAVETLRPYWKIRDDVEKMLGEPKTPYQVMRFDRLVSRLRKRLRRIDPQVEKYYQMFYAKQ